MLGKRIISIVLVCAMVVALAACAKPAAAPQAPAATEAPTAEPAKEAAKEEPAAAEEQQIDWPKKTIEFVVPAGAGGDTDFNARLLAQYLSEELGVSIVISNVGGSGGTVGTRQVKDSDPDGNTVLFYHSAFVVNQLSGAAEYGLDAFDFACIAAMSAGNCITVSSSLGVKTFDELVQYSHDHPGELTFAAQTAGTTHALALLLTNVVGMDLTIIDAGGAADRLTALLGGHVDVITAAYGTIKDYVTDGTLVPLALDGFSDNETTGLKCLKTLGYDVGFPFYYFCAFPKGTDPKIIEKFNAAVEKVVTTNTEYADGIAEAYLQKPTFFGTEEGSAKFAELCKLFENVDFNA